MPDGGPKPNRWRHVQTGTTATVVGDDRDGHGTPYVLMKLDDGRVARISPLDLVRVPAAWEKLDAEVADAQA